MSSKPTNTTSSRGRAARVMMALAIVAFAAWALHRHGASLSWPDLLHALRHGSRERLVASLALTTLSFMALGGFDLLGCRVVVPGRVPWRRAMLAGAAGNALSNTLGFHALTGSAVRLRIYRDSGVRLADTLRVVSLSWLAIGLGFMAMLGMGLSWGGRPATGVGILVLLTALLAWLCRRDRVLAWRSFRLALPPAWAAVGLMALGAVESAAAIGALYVLLPSGTAPPFMWFTAAYVGAVLLGIAAHVPGGLGVFEAAFVAMLPGQDRAGLLAALLLYRLVYNLVPFVVLGGACAVLAARQGQLDKG